MKPVLYLLVGLLLSTVAFAHGADEVPGVISGMVQIKGHDITFVQSEQKIVAGKDATFSIVVENAGHEVVSGLEVQGQVLDSQVGKEIYFAAVTETDEGIYSFDWNPSFAGDYLVQFIFRSGNESIEPVFSVSVVDSKASTALLIGGVLAVVVLAAGIFFALPRGKRKFSPKPLAFGAVGAAILVVFAFGVSTYFASGGEKGFVVCGAEGCELAVHWHSQLELSACGEVINLPLEVGDLNKQHTHKERDTLHFHALIRTDEEGKELLEPEKLHLGELFSVLNMTFNDTCFGGYCNGDICPDGSAGTLAMKVNGVPNTDYDTYVWRDGDTIEISFGEVN